MTTRLQIDITVYPDWRPGARRVLTLESESLEKLGALVVEIAPSLAALAQGLGWAYDYTKYAAQIIGASLEFGPLTSLTSLVAAVGGNVKLEYPVTVRPNLNATIVAQSSVFRKCTAMALSDLMWLTFADIVVGADASGQSTSRI